MLTVTTSWDDGDVLDIRVAELLDRYGMKGTFYITKEHTPRLSEENIKALARRHEIGAHTLTHPDLSTLKPEQQKEEIAGSKQWLEAVLGSEVRMFCYPFGRFNDSAKHAAKEAGFLGARTTQLGFAHLSDDAFEMGTTVHAYPFPFRKKNATTFNWRYLLQPWQQRAHELRRLGVPLLALRSWDRAARAAFDIAHAEGRTFHLWGHSWEIEKYGMWEELERALAYVGNRKDCEYRTNGEMIEAKLRSKFL